MQASLSFFYGGGMPASEQSRAAEELATTVAQLARRLRAASPEGSLTPSQRTVLARLAQQGPATTAALARAELVRPQSMRATLAALEEQELVARSPHPTDGRQVVFSVTDAGLKRFDALRHAKRSWLADAIEAELDEDELRTLTAATALIRRLAQW